jgi:hypothetical protein
MTFMSTATLTAPAVPTTSLTDRLNALLETQKVTNPERTLGLLDRCDRCSQHAQAQFDFRLPLPDGTTELRDIMLCGHHTRMHVEGILDKHPEKVWIEPSVLALFKGVKVEVDQAEKTGDGLTDV